MLTLLGGALLTVLATTLLCAPLVTFVPVLVRDVFRGGAMPQWNAPAPGHAGADAARTKLRGPRRV